MLPEPPSDAVLVSVRIAIIRMVLDGERRPSCCSKPEWDIAKALARYYGARALGPLEDLRNVQ